MLHSVTEELNVQIKPMKKYLITGVAGFVGSSVANTLLEQGSYVVGIDNLNHSYDPRIKAYRLRQLEAHEKFTFYRLDISDRSIISNPRLSEDIFSAVINFAARAGVRESFQDPWIYLQSNTTGTLNLLEFSVKNAVKKFILASSSSVYGLEAPIPTPESASTDKPLQVYAASKVAAEAVAYAYHFQHEFDVSVLRYFNVYGPAGRPDMIMFRLAKWISEGLPVTIYGTGAQTRGFTYVDDIAKGTIAALNLVGYNIINLGGHESISLADLITRFENIIGKKARIVHQARHPADLMVNQADISKAMDVLDWTPEYDLDHGIKNVVDWYQQERSWAKDVPTD